MDALGYVLQQILHIFRIVQRRRLSRMRHLDRVPGGYTRAGQRSKPAKQSRDRLIIINHPYRSTDTRISKTEGQRWEMYKVKLSRDTVTKV